MKNLLLIIACFSFLMACKPKTEQKNEQKIENIDTMASAKSPAISLADEAISFGFSNEAGTQILAFEENTNPKFYTQTLDNKGNIVSVSFLKTQKGNESGVNLVSQNIANCAGQLFAVNEVKKVNNNFSSVIFNEAFLKNHQLLAVKTLEKPQNIDKKIKTAIETERKRAVKNAWKIADIGENLIAYIVVFAPKKDSVLASLVIGNQTFTYRDYPAKFDEGSTWRVDDGGEFPNDAIRILAVFRNQKNELEIVTEWAGAEGANIEYAKANKNIFETVKEASRYWGAL